MSYRNEPIFAQSTLQAFGQPWASMQQILNDALGGGMAEVFEVFRRQEALFDSLAFSSIEAFKPSTSGLATVTGVATLISRDSHWAKISALAAFSSAFEDVQKLLSGQRAMLASSIAALVSLPEEGSLFRAVRQPILRARLQRTAHISLESCLDIVTEDNATLDDSNLPLSSVRDIEHQTAVSAAAVVAFSLDKSELEETDFESITAPLSDGNEWTELPRALGRLHPALERALIASRIRREAEGSPGYIEHAAISMRKIFERVLALLAPKEQVKSWLSTREFPVPPNWTKNKSQPSQTAQIAYLLRHIDTPATGRMQKFYSAQVEMASMLLRSLHDCAHDIDYEISHHQFVTAQLHMEVVLRSVLRFHLESN